MSSTNSFFRTGVLVTVSIVAAVAIVYMAQPPAEKPTSVIELENKMWIGTQGIIVFQKNTVYILRPNIRRHVAKGSYTSKGKTITIKKSGIEWMKKSLTYSVSNNILTLGKYQFQELTTLVRTDSMIYPLDSFTVNPSTMSITTSDKVFADIRYPNKSLPTIIWSDGTFDYHALVCVEVGRPYELEGSLQYDLTFCETTFRSKDQRLSDRQKKWISLLEMPEVSFDNSVIIGYFQDEQTSSAQVDGSWIYSDDKQQIHTLKLNNGNASGTSCNTFSGSYSLNDKSIIFGAFMSTKRFCQDKADILINTFSNQTLEFTLTKTSYFDDELTIGELNFVREPEVVAGRPLRKKQDLIVSEHIETEEWSYTFEPALIKEIKTMPNKQAFSEKWLDAAAAEHSSVASFSNLTLQLMELGAPPHLLQTITGAQQDEIKHAKMAYTLAGIAANQDYGPSKLDVNDTRTPATFDSVLKETIRDACIGEAAAAKDLMQQANEAENAAYLHYANVLREMASDEERHAQLGHAIVGWIIAQ